LFQIGVMAAVEREFWCQATVCHQLQQEARQLTVELLAARVRAQLQAVALQAVSALALFLFAALLGELESSAV
jgi:hypothetical protein